MTNPIQHAKELKEELEKLSSEEKSRYAAWCIYYFTKDLDALTFISENISRDIVKLAKELPVALWEQKLDRSKIKNYLDVISKVDWNHDDLAEEDDDASQGAMDLLASIQFALQGVLNDSASEVVDCAINVSNRIDYMINFFDHPESGLEDEYKRQKEFISLIKSQKATIDWKR